MVCFVILNQTRRSQRVERFSLGRVRNAVFWMKKLNIVSIKTRKCCHNIISTVVLVLETANKAKKLASDASKNYYLVHG